MGIDCLCCEALDEPDKETASVDSNDSSEEGGGEEGILECDYDTQVTKLYRSIEEKNWEEVLYFLETKKWYNHSVLFSLWSEPEESPAVQARKWVTALDEKGSVRWCQLPIHASITFNAPFSIISKLVEVYPKSVRCADDQDMLPLHYAFRFGAPDDVLLFLLEKFPQAISKKAVKDRLPLDLAQYGSLPDRGKIIDYYMQSAVRNAKHEWDTEYEKMVANMKGVADHELQHHLQAKTTKLVTTLAELNSTKQQVVDLQKELNTAKRELKDNNNNSMRSTFKRSIGPSNKSNNTRSSSSPLFDGGITTDSESISDESNTNKHTTTIHKNAEAGDDEEDEDKAIPAPKRRTNPLNTNNNTKPKTRIRSLSQPRMTKKGDEGSRRSSRTGDTSRRSKGRRSVDDMSSRRSIKSRSSSKGPKSRKQIKKSSPNLLKMFGLIKSR
jgi:hypothetical protein